MAFPALEEEMTLALDIPQFRRTVAENGGEGSLAIAYSLYSQGAHDDRQSAELGAVYACGVSDFLVSCHLAWESTNGTAL